MCKIISHIKAYKRTKKNKTKHATQKIINISSEVLYNIKNTVAAIPAESGGLLGCTNAKTGKIDTYVSDDSARITSATYTPDIQTLNKILQYEWDPKGITVAGLVHSHPAGYTKLSYGDYVYIERIMKGLRNAELHLDYLFFPIVQTVPDTGKFSIYPYVAHLEKEECIIESCTLYVDGKPYEEPATDRTIAPHKFDKIENLYDLKALADKHICGFGAGGARHYYELLARSGVKNFTLFDGDVVSDTNIATQEVYCSEMKSKKVLAVKKAILDINPEANVTVCDKFLTDELTDEMIEQIVPDLVKHPERMLLCGCTDSFICNARVARLALKYGTPYLQAGLYKSGKGCEISFFVPGLSDNCTRCQTDKRYDMYKENADSLTVASDACPVFATELMNAYKGYLSMLILTRNASKENLEILKGIANKNFIQINLDMTKPNFGAPVFFDQVPSNEKNGFRQCPDCKGTGDLIDAAKCIKDSRKIF